MELNQDLPEIMNIHPAILPVDSQAGNVTGLVVSLKGYAGALVMLQKKAGVAGDDIVFTLLQGTAIAFSTNKALPFTRIYEKLHATTVPGTWTLVEQAAANTYTNLTSAEKAGLIAVDIKSEMLDVDNGYDCIRLDIPDTGSAGAQLISASYLLYGARYAGASMISPLVD